jgi:hypothetical protein
LTFGSELAEVESLGIVRIGSSKKFSRAFKVGHLSLIVREKLRKVWVMFVSYHEVLYGLVFK